MAYPYIIYGIPQQSTTRDILNKLNEDTPYSALVQTLKDPSFKSAHSIIFINILTLVRNYLSFHKNLPSTSDIILQIQELMEAFYIYTRRANIPVLKIIFYVNDYSHIPQSLKRNTKTLKNTIKSVTQLCTSLQFYQSLADLIISTYLPRNEDLDTVTTHYYINYHQILQPRKVFPPFTILKGIYTSNMFSHESIMFISHLPIDYHIKCKTYGVLDSFTGKYHTPTSLSRKLFKNPKIIFSKTTHGFWGDRNLIKPILSKKEKEFLTSNELRRVLTTWTDLNLANVLNKASPYKIPVLKNFLKTFKKI